MDLASPDRAVDWAFPGRYEGTSDSSGLLFFSTGKKSGYHKTEIYYTHTNAKNANSGTVSMLNATAWSHYQGSGSGGC